MKRYKVLVLRLSAVGDVIRVLPAVKALKQSHPASFVTWVVEEPSKPLLESQPEVDEVILFPRRRWAEGIKSPKGVWRTIGEVRRFILGLRRRKFDAALDFHGILKSGLISFVSGAPIRVGFDRRSTQEGNFIFSNVKVTLPERKMSRIQKNFALVKRMGLKTEEFNPKLHIPSEESEAVESFFGHLPKPLPRPIIAIHPGTSPKTSYKRWMSLRYSRLADRLIHELRASVVFTWGPQELDLVEGIRRRMEEESVLGPRTESLTQLAEVFRRCDVYVGGDTGPMHVASFMGIPVVVIYGPTDPVVNEPFGPCKKVMNDVGCNPCRKRNCKELACLKGVAVDDVLKAVKEMLSLTP
jgi:heptosyltransferase I